MENGNLNIVLKTYELEVLNEIYAFKNTICAVEPVKQTEIQMDVWLVWSFIDLVLTWVNAMEAFLALKQYNECPLSNIHAKCPLSNIHAKKHVDGFFRAIAYLLE